MIPYECLRCGGSMTDDDLQNRGDHVKCIYCGYKMLKKTKSPRVKRVDTR